jgi:hypothetical protein
LPQLLMRDAGSGDRERGRERDQCDEPLHGHSVPLGGVKRRGGSA